MQSHPSEMSRARRVVGNVLVIFSGVLLVGSALAKFGRVAPVVRQLGQLGFFGDRLMFIAVLEIASGLLFLVPRTRALGLLLASAYMGGAMAAHLSHGESMLQPAVILALLWIATAARQPEAFWSFTNDVVVEHSKGAVS
jgi:DoxX-like protein